MKRSTEMTQSLETLDPNLLDKELLARIPNEEKLPEKGSNSELDMRPIDDFKESFDPFDNILTDKSPNVADIINTSSISNVNSDFSLEPNRQQKVNEIIQLNRNLKAEIERLIKDNEALRTAELEGNTSVDILFKNVEHISEKLSFIANTLEEKNMNYREREKGLVNLISMVKNIPDRLNEIVQAYKKATALRRTTQSSSSVGLLSKIDGSDIDTKNIPKIEIPTDKTGILQSITVLCRIKPPDVENCINVSSDNKIYLQPFRNFTNGADFQLENVLLPDADQEKVFTYVSPVLESCFNGCNVCVLAYGQSGSGKTHTMLGTKNNPGLIFRAMSELQRINQFSQMKQIFNLSILEVYNENIYDLLGYSSGDAKTKVIIQDNGQSVQIKNVTEAVVNNEDELKEFLERSERLRNTAIGKKHFSSRSHFMVMVRICDTQTRGVLMMCDLAGSENSHDLDKQQQNESRYINKSITMLTRVFDALYKRQRLVPFRDSKLTHLLKPSLMGNAKCMFIATVCSDGSNLLDTYRTLNVAKKVEKITFPKMI